MAPQHKNPTTPEFDSEATKLHIFLAGRELLLAAQGALAFCKHYVETSRQESRRPELARFFSRALAVANDLVGPIASTIEQEMRTTTPPPRSGKGGRRRKDSRR